MKDGTKILLAAVVVIVAFGVGMTVLAGLSSQRGESTYTGQVVDVEVEKGVVFQTTQGKLKTHRRSSTVETFCVHPSNHDDQVPKLKQALERGDRVRITYSRPLYVSIWDCEAGTSIIRDVEVMNESDPE